MIKINPERTYRYYSLKFKRLKGDPAFLARGVAIGVFIGITPTIPFHTIITVAVAFLLRSSVISALLSTVTVSNPLTVVPQYYLSMKVGNMITPYNLTWDRFATIMQLIEQDAAFSEIMTALGQLGQESLIVLLLGGAILAAPFSVASYILSFNFFLAIQRKRRKKHRLD